MTDFTIGGKTPEEMDREAAARQRQAAAAAALNGYQNPSDMAQAAYRGMSRVPQAQRAFNAEAEARAEAQAKALGVNDPDMINRFIAAEKLKFTQSPDAQVPDICRKSAAARQAGAERKVEEVRAGLAPKSNDVAELMRQQAIWDAERAILDSKENVGAAAAAAAEAIVNAADAEEVAVYAQRFPKYFEARGHKDIDFVDRALTARSPEYAAAKQEQREELINATVTSHTAGYLERCAASGIPADPRVLAKLDPNQIASTRNLGR